MDCDKFFFVFKMATGVFFWGLLSILYCFTVLITNVSTDFFINLVAVEYATPLYWTILATSITYGISSVLLCVGVLKVCCLN